MNKSSTSLTDPRIKFEAVPMSDRLIYRNVLALRTVKTKLEAWVTENLFTAGGFHLLAPEDVSGAIGGAKSVLRGSRIERLVNARSLLDIAESSPEFKAAESKLAPLYAELAAYEEEQEAMRQEEAGRIAALAKARCKAREAALASVESDPEVTRARAAVERAELVT